MLRKATISLLIVNSNELDQKSQRKTKKNKKIKKILLPLPFS
jgi:hypothetical protein